MYIKIIIACLVLFGGALIAGEKENNPSGTCIVAIRTGNGVIMGCDSCAGRGTESMVVKTPYKVAKVGEFLIGYTTSFRMGQLLHTAVSPIKHNPNEDIYHEIITVLIPEIRRVFKDGGYLTTANGNEEGGEFLLAHGNRIFRVHSDFCVLEYDGPFIACGCGEKLAMGALRAAQVINEKHNDMRPKDMLELALQTAEKYSGYVRGPFNYVDNLPNISGKR